MMRPAAALLFLGVVACSPSTEWARHGTSPEQRQTDEKECHDIASWQALDESDKSRPIYPPYRDTQFLESGGEDGSAGTTSYSRRGPRMYELSIYCMEQRGYHLQPIAKKP
ncbi:MAG: hypothetical protein KG075_01420 [Alphaproteobacteria bacterium]|nr:hypothetical protein [Alphaproteobacteria bacterium]